MNGNVHYVNEEYNSADLSRSTNFLFCTKIDKRRSGLKGLHKNPLSCCLEIIRVNSYNGKNENTIG